MKLYCNIPTSPPNALARIAADLAGQEIEVIVATEEVRKSAEYKALTTTDKFPLLVTKDGNLHESSAIARYFCATAGKFYGTTPVEKTQVDQWCSFASTSWYPHIENVCNGIFGWADITQAEWNESSKFVKAQFKIINTHLDGKQWLVGNEITVADINVAIIYSLVLQTILDGGYRKAMKNASDWAERVFAHPSVVKVIGQTTLCAKALKPICKEEAKPVKKAAPVQAKKVEKVEKKLDNVESLPPTSFNLYDFKTFYVNAADKKGAAVDEWYKMLDWEGWTFWHLFYDKYEGEGEKLHVTNNLLGGFLNRAEHTNKYCFGRIGVFGEEPNLDIKGVWLMRGTELPDGLVKEHPQFEYYKTRKMDPRNNKDDDKLVREYFGGAEEEIIEGAKCQTLKWFK